MQVGTYNVNGRRPPADLDLRPWLDMSNHTADIVAVGFQEVVPLNAGNVVMGRLSQPTSSLKRNEKTTPFGVSLMGSQVLYRAAQYLKPAFAPELT